MSTNICIEPTLYGINKYRLKVFTDLVSVYLSHVGASYLKTQNSFKNPRSFDNDFFVLYHCFEGKGTVHTQKGDFLLAPNDLVLIHNQDKLSLQAVSESWRFASVFFYTNNTQLPLYKKYAVPFLEDEETHILNMITLLQSGKVLDSAKANSLFQSMLYGVLEKMHLQDDNSPYAEMMQQMDAYIRQNLNGDLSLETLSKRCCLSKNYFCTLFKQYFQIAPKAYILKLKMEKASLLLTHSNIPVWEIADKLAFYSPAHFASQFKRYFNETPLEHRRKR